MTKSNFSIDSLWNVKSPYFVLLAPQDSTLPFVMSQRVPIALTAHLCVGSITAPLESVIFLFKIRRVVEYHNSLLFVLLFPSSSSSSSSFSSSSSLRAYWGLRNHFPAEADALYNSLESSYQRTLQSCLKSSGSVASLPQSDRSSSSSQESLK